MGSCSYPLFRWAAQGKTEVHWLTALSGLWPNCDLPFDWPEAARGPCSDCVLTVPQCQVTHGQSREFVPEGYPRRIRFVTLAVLLEVTLAAQRPEVIEVVDLAAVNEAT